MKKIKSQIWETIVSGQFIGGKLYFITSLGNTINVVPNHPKPLSENYPLQQIHDGQIFDNIIGGTFSGNTLIIEKKDGSTIEIDGSVPTFPEPTENRKRLFFEQIEDRIVAGSIVDDNKIILYLADGDELIINGFPGVDVYPDGEPDFEISTTTTTIPPTTTTTTTVAPTTTTTTTVAVEECTFDFTDAKFYSTGNSIQVDNSFGGTNPDGGWVVGETITFGEDWTVVEDEEGSDSISPALNHHNYFRGNTFEITTGGESSFTLTANFTYANFRTKYVSGDIVYSGDCVEIVDSPVITTTTTYSGQPFNRVSNTTSYSTNGVVTFMPSDYREDESGMYCAFVDELIVGDPTVNQKTAGGSTKKFYGEFKPGTQLYDYQGNILWWYEGFYTMKLYGNDGEYSSNEYLMVEFREGIIQKIINVGNRVYTYNDGTVQGEIYTNNDLYGTCVEPLPTFDCSTPGLSIIVPDGTAGDRVQTSGEYYPSGVVGEGESVDIFHFFNYTDPINLIEGTNDYTVNVTIPDGFANSEVTIDCVVSATAEAAGEVYDQFNPDPSEVTNMVYLLYGDGYYNFNTPMSYETVYGRNDTIITNADYTSRARIAFYSEIDSEGKPVIGSYVKANNVMLTEAGYDIQWANNQFDFRSVANSDITNFTENDGYSYSFKNIIRYEVAPNGYAYVAEIIDEIVSEPSTAPVLGEITLELLRTSYFATPFRSSSNSGYLHAAQVGENVVELGIPNEHFYVIKDSATEMHLSSDGIDWEIFTINSWVDDFITINETFDRNISRGEYVRFKFEGDITFANFGPAFTTYFSNHPPVSGNSISSLSNSNHTPWKRTGEYSIQGLLNKKMLLVNDAGDSPEMVYEITSIEPKESDNTYDDVLFSPSYLNFGPNTYTKFRFPNS